MEKTITKLIFKKTKDINKIGRCIDCEANNLCQKIIECKAKDNEMYKVRNYIKFIQKLLTN